MKKGDVKRIKMLKQYYYHGKNSFGKTIKGKMKHYSKDNVITYLKQQGIWIFHIKEQHPILDRLENFFIPKKIPKKELPLFFSQLSTMLAIGIPLLDALHILQSQVKSLSLQKAIQDIYILVQQGYSLSVAMKIQGQIPLFSILSIEVGEKSGNLELTLQELGDYYEQSNFMLQQIKTALTYPLFVLVTTFLVFIAFIYFLLPILNDLLSTIHDSISPFTLILLRFLEFIKKTSWIWIIVFFLLALFLSFYKKTFRGAKVWNYFCLHLPMVKEWTTQRMVIRFSKTLGVLLGSGIPLLPALEQTVSVLGNPYIQHCFIQSIQNIRAGSTLSEEIQTYSFFPKKFVQMIVLGEQTGDLEEMMKKASKIYEKELNLQYKQWIALLEPLFILFVAFFVGGMLFFILQPMMQILNGIGEGF